MELWEKEGIPCVPLAQAVKFQLVVEVAWATEEATVSSASYVIVSLPKSQPTGEGELREVRYPLRGEDVTLGSSPHATISLPFEGIADRHVQIFYVDGEWHIEDVSRGPALLKREGICFRHHIIAEDGEAFFLGSIEVQVFLGNTRRSLNHDEMYQRSMTDPLTQAQNRRSFEQNLVQFMGAVPHRHPWLSLVVFDIDHFKDFNTLYGHAGGDHVLKEVVQRTRALVRENEVVARIGGEEFAVLLPDVGPDEALEVAERIRKAVADQAFFVRKESENQPVRVTLSAGVASTDQPRDGHVFLAQADQRLLRAKQRGRNCVEDC